MNGMASAATVKFYFWVADKSGSESTNDHKRVVGTNPTGELITSGLPVIREQSRNCVLLVDLSRSRSCPSPAAPTNQIAAIGTAAYLLSTFAANTKRQQ
jgi:hypothetical protein